MATGKREAKKASAGELAKAAGEAPRSPLFKGYVKALFSLRPEQDQSLRAEALRRALAAGVSRPDASALVREALDAWLKKNVKG